MVRRVVAAGAAVIAVVGIIAGPAFAKGPSIAITVPQSVAAGSTYTIKVSGYFNCTKKNLDRGCANIAFVTQLQGLRRCTKNAVGRPGGPALASGTRDRRLRAKTPTKPGRFSANEQVKGPTTTGPYTLCAFLLSYPVGGVTNRTASAHLTVTAPVMYTLTVAIAGSAGYGRVDGYADSDSGDSIFCSASQSDNQCSHSYRPGTVVHLSEATEALDSIFDGWSGPCSFTGEFCDVKMDSDHTMTATFNQIS